MFRDSRWNGIRNRGFGLARIEGQPPTTSKGHFAGFTISSGSLQSGEAAGDMGYVRETHVLQGFRRNGRSTA
jgi:hypothetical protein